METWADETPLYIWSGERAADLEPVKVAKRQLDAEWEQAWGQPSPYRVRPIGVASAVDLPLDARVLAIGSRPPFFCDYALVHESSPPAGWHAALLWVLGIVPVDSRATTMLDTVRSIFPGAEEISEEQLESERRLAAFQAGGDA